MKIITFNTNEIKEKIALGLGNELLKDGYIYTKTKNEFKRQIGDYTYFFILEQLSWSDHYSIKVTLAISQRKIESYLEKIIGKLRHKYTFLQDIARIYKSPDGKQIVNGNLVILLIYNEDTEAAIETLQEYYEKIAKPYFEKYDNLEAINNIMNNAPCWSERIS